MAYQYGDLVLGRYGRFKLDPVPMVFVLLADDTYTEGINSNYITKAEAIYLRRMMASYPDNVGNKVYYKLKAEGHAILRAYRKYFTNRFVGIGKWKVQAYNKGDFKTTSETHKDLLAQRITKGRKRSYE